MNGRGGRRKERLRERVRELERELERERNSDRLTASRGTRGQTERSGEGMENACMCVFNNEECVSLRERGEREREREIKFSLTEKNIYRKIEVKDCCLTCDCK